MSNLYEGPYPVDLSQDEALIETGQVIKANFGGRPYPELVALEQAVWDTLMNYRGTVPLMGAVGVLRLIEHRLLADATA